MMRNFDKQDNKYTVNHGRLLFRTASAVYKRVYLPRRRFTATTNRVIAYISDTHASVDKGLPASDERMRNAYHVQSNTRASCFCVSFVVVARRALILFWTIIGVIFYNYSPHTKIRSRSIQHRTQNPRRGILARYIQETSVCVSSHIRIFNM